jgi:hypothetical protein
VLDGPPAPLHRVNPPPPAELVAVCEKAMHRAKSERYASALEMSEDLQAYLDGRVVKAYEGGPVARAPEVGGAQPQHGGGRRRRRPRHHRRPPVGGGHETRANRELREENDKVLRLSDVKRLKDYVEEGRRALALRPRKSRRRWSRG